MDKRLQQFLDAENLSQAPRRVSKILVFYDDNTFEEFQ